MIELICEVIAIRNHLDKFVIDLLILQEELVVLSIVNFRCFLDGRANWHVELRYILTE